MQKRKSKMSSCEWVGWVQNDYEYLYSSATNFAEMESLIEIDEI